MSKIERIKAATDGLDVLPELLRAAREGWETLDPDHVGLLKWYGLYAHNTGDGHFMMQIGKAGKTEGSNSKEYLGRPAMAVIDAGYEVVLATPNGKPAITAPAAKTSG